MTILKYFCLAAFVLAFTSYVQANYPEQVVAQLAGNGNYVISWITGSNVSNNSTYTDGTPKTNLYFGSSPDLISQLSVGSRFKSKIHGYKAHHHHAIIPAKYIVPGTEIYYKVGDASKPNGVSEVFNLKTIPDGKHSMCIFGDLGTDSTMMQTVNILYHEIIMGTIQGILHIGDMAYDLHSAFGLNGDIFMNAIMPLTTRVPYMFGAGNHEAKYEFAHFLNRYNAQSLLAESSDSPLPFWYSFNQGYVHYIILNTELYKYPIDTLSDEQEAWLRADLKKANANRAQVPWVVVLGHKCEWQETQTGMKILLDIARKEGTDIYFCGHQHNYQRLHPGYNGVYTPSPNPNFIENPTDWVQIVSGAASRSVSAKNPHPNALAHFTNNLGYGVLTANATHIHWRFRRTHDVTTDEPSVAIIDQLVIKSDSHGPRNV